MNVTHAQVREIVDRAVSFTKDSMSANHAQEMVSIAPPLSVRSLAEAIKIVLGPSDEKAEYAFVTCRNCDGVGRWLFFRCKKCGGSGRQSVQRIPGEVLSQVAEAHAAEYRSRLKRIEDEEEACERGRMRAQFGVRSDRT